MYFFANFINIFIQLLKNYYIMHIIKETLNFNFMKEESYFCFEITKIKEWNAIFSIWFFNLHRLCVSFSILCVIYVSIVFPSSMGKIVLFWDTYHNIKLICFFSIINSIEPPVLLHYMVVQQLPREAIDAQRAKCHIRYTDGCSKLSVETASRLKITGCMIIYLFATFF